MTIFAFGAGKLTYMLWLLIKTLWVWWLRINFTHFRIIC